MQHIQQRMARVWTLLNLLFFSLIYRSLSVSRVSYFLSFLSVFFGLPSYETLAEASHCMPTVLSLFALV
jgi:hypothetical protein